MDFLTNILTGSVLAIALPCMGSAKGVGLVAEAASGLLSEDPNKFGKAFLLIALPSSQAIYGFVTAVLIFFLKYSPDMTVENGAYYLMAALPIAIAGYASAVKQGRVAATSPVKLSSTPQWSRPSLSLHSLFRFSWSLCTDRSKRQSTQRPNPQN